MNTLETQVLNLIGENVDSPDVFTDDDTGLEPIRESLNDAIEEITILTGSYRETYSVPLISGQPTYRMRLTHGDIAWITDARLLSTKRRLKQTSVQALSIDNPRWLQNDGPPEVYIPIGHNIVMVWPVPTGDDILEITAVVSPLRMSTSTDRIRLRETMKWTAVDFAIGEFYASRGDAKEAMLWHQKYLNGLGVLGTYPKSQERIYQVGNRNEVPRP